MEGPPVSSHFLSVLTSRDPHTYCCAHLLGVSPWEYIIVYCVVLFTVTSCHIISCYIVTYMCRITYYILYYIVLYMISYCIRPYRIIYHIL